MSDNFEDIYFKAFVAKQKARLTYLKSKALPILICCAIGAGVGAAIASFTKPKYNAELSFVLSTDSKSSGFSGIASQFGLDLGGSSANDVFSGDNILTLFKSERMIKSVLFKKPENQKEILANIIAREWNWDIKWQKKERTAKAFPFPDKYDKTTPVQDSLLQEIHDQIVEKCLTVSRTDKKLNVYVLKTTSTNEAFACALTKNLMDETAQFYIETKTSSAKRNLQMLQKEADSLRYLLGRSLTTTASSLDNTFNLNSALQVERVVTQKSQANSGVIGAAYGEVVKNLEIAKITLLRETPLYQIIDSPSTPLKQQLPSALLYAVIGSLIFAFVCMITLLILQPNNAAIFKIKSNIKTPILSN